MNIYCFSTLSFAKLQFKSVINKAFHKHGVASFTDAWIETLRYLIEWTGLDVASFTDAWIETQQRVRRPQFRKVASFTDAWIETVVTATTGNRIGVASFTDAWIETHDLRTVADLSKSHLLQMRGLKLTYCRMISLKCSSRIFYRCVD